MYWPSLALIPLLATGSPDVEQVRLTPLPRLPGRADVQVWRSVAHGQLAYGGRTRPLFVRADDADALAALAALGVPAQLGRWAPARLDGAALESALSAMGRLRVRAAPAHRLTLDVAIGEVGADRAHAGKGLEMPRRGDGVLIGIVDSGIDLSHPAFHDAAGRSRVIAVWDQDAADGPSPETFGYGRECRQKEIRADDCPITDPSGHGTHVAGIAAGSAHPRGIAPDAEIAVVRSDTFTRLADAVLYLAELAEERDMPLVVNLSVGGQYGPHDGRTPLETYLSDIVGPGRIVVAAAGNDGNDRIHIGAQLGDTPQRIGLEAVPVGVPADTLVDLWSAGDAEVELTLEVWVRNSPVASAPLWASDSTLLDGELWLGEHLIAEVSYGLEFDAEHHRTHRTIVIDTSRAEALPSDGRLAVRVAGSGTIDGWISMSDYRWGVAQFTAGEGEGWIAGDGERSVTVPASAPGIVSVGAYTARVNWVSETEGKRSLAGLTLGELAPYSGRGPTLAPEYTGVKPEIVAPGTVVASARAAGVPPGVMTIDADRRVMQGTSMAAPFVTGAVALMLEADPQLGAKRARAQLTRTARVDASVGSVPNARWGYGKLNVGKAVGAAEADASGCAAAPVPWSLALVFVPLLLSRRRRR